jgi:hypothetical protein
MCDFEAEAVGVEEFGLEVGGVEVPLEAGEEVEGKVGDGTNSAKCVLDLVDGRVAEVGGWDVGGKELEDDGLFEVEGEMAKSDAELEFAARAGEHGVAAQRDQTESPTRLTFNRIDFDQDDRYLRPISGSIRRDRRTCGAGYVVLGSLPSVRAGGWLIADGWWVRDKEHGFQFKAKILKTIPPCYGERV